MLSIRHFKKTYPGTDEPVLSIPSLALTKGIYRIKGENGSGKTSLIKSIAGLIPFDGLLEVNGLNIKTNRMAYTRAVNYAEAEPLYPAFLSGKELIAFYHSTKGGSLPATFIEQLGLDQFSNNKTAVYSSGMMKKLSLTLAFIGEPKLILLDEPLIALDAAAVQVLQHTIVAFSQRGTSFIITSHQPFEGNIVPVSQSFLIQGKTLQEEAE